MTKKEKAVQILKQLNIYKPYINGFQKKGDICFFERYGGYWSYQEPELMDKIKEFEDKHKALVYAVTHEFTDFGECYDFMFVPDCEDEWGDLVVDMNNGSFCVFAYVWNKDDEWCSEFGDILIKSMYGGICRIA